jgi:hydroxymethylpyrimidine pyrophosphatase-like HAD family hydrolase
VLLSTNNETVERVHEISWQGFLDVRRLAPQGAVKACMAITIPPDPVPGEPEEPDAFIITADGRFFYATAAWEPERQLVSQEFAVPEEVALSRRLVHAAFHVAEPHFVNDLMEIVREHYREDASVYAMQPPRTSGILIDIVARGGKGLAVRDLAVSLGIPDDAIAAIGDGMNDFLLLEAAQFRYAVRGSALARRYAGAIEVGAAGAVADALERFLSELC